MPAGRPTDYDRAQSGPVVSFVIYCLVDPRDKQVRYVGMTKDPKERLRRHLCEARRGAGTKRLRWLRDLATAGVVPEMVELESVADWHEGEQFWVAYFKAIGADLVNGNEGGRCGVTEASRKPWEAGIRGVHCPTAIFLRHSAAFGVSAAYRDTFRKTLKKMNERARCEAELRFAQIMWSRAAGPVDRWISAAAEKTLAVACG